MILVIVESPSKARTISSYLGEDYKVLASFGHIMDLPKKVYGIDFQNNFEPQFEINPKAKKNIKYIIEEAKKSSEIILATDADREGEAISFHLQEILKKFQKKISRIYFKEITKKEILNSINNKKQIDKNLVEAQYSRRVLDRIFGFELSPVLWKFLSNYFLSAGRVQSVALKWIVEREKEILEFIPKEFFQINLNINQNGEDYLFQNIEKINSKEELEHTLDKMNLKNLELGETIQKNIFLKIIEAKEKKIISPSPPPFITSSLQKEASNYLKFPPDKTMKLAQKLYEGINIGEKKITGLITYMRTDSFRVSDDIKEEAKKYIEKNFGKDFHKEKISKNKNNSQDAHEAIRPTSLSHTPESLKSFLKKEELELYKMIFNRFLESQMSEHEFIKKEIIGEINSIKFHYFENEDIKLGYKILREKKENKSKLKFKIGENIKIEKINLEQKFTESPHRFTEASLIEKLEKSGIGRPSTYSNTLETLYKRAYVEKKEKSLHPIGFSFDVIEILKQNFFQFLEDEFTKKMEDDLDLISIGKKERGIFIKEFYDELTKLKTVSRKVKSNINEIKQKKESCPSCGKNLEKKKSKKGKFYFLCSGFPSCDFMKYID